MKSPRSETREARHAAFVLFPGALGDFICLMPALQMLAHDFDVHLFARSEYADLTPPTMRVRSLECYEIRRLFAPDAAVEERVRRFFEPYVQIYSWMGSRQGTFVREFSRVAGDRGRIFPFQSDAPVQHQAEYYLSCLGQNGCETPLPEIARRPEADRWAAEFWARRRLEERLVLAIAPGSGSREKSWPVERFCAVRDCWRRAPGGEVVVLLGPVEAERGGFEPLVHGAVAARNTSLAQIAALLRLSHAYLGNDSGITHLAGAIGVRTIALFGPSDPQRWRPRGRHVTVVDAAAFGRCLNGIAEPPRDGTSLLKLTSDAVINRMEKVREVASLTRLGSGITVFG